MSKEVEIFFAVHEYREEWMKLWKNEKFLRMITEDGVAFTVHIFYYVNYKDSGLEVINLN